MNNTPETDNLARGNHVVPTEFARDLERERDEALRLHRDALREREAAEREADDTLGRVHKAERERDEAKKELADFNKRFVDKCFQEARLQMQVDEKWALRRELEAELGITDEMASDESLRVGLEVIKALKRERDDLKKRLNGVLNALNEASK
jgi:uncharacterized protein (DUF3084 family)